MSRHIDLIAIAILLLAIATVSAARHAAITAMHRQIRVIRLDNGPRQVRLPRL
jgi:hypothetical protein